MRLNFTRDPDIFTDRSYIRANYVVIILLISGIALLTVSILLSNGMAGLTPVQIATIIGVALIVLSIIISFRKKFFQSMLVFTLLLALYFVEGIVLAYFNIVPQPFSIGIASTVYIWAFVRWIRHEGLKWDDVTKILAFMFISYVVNITTWIPQLDSLLNTLLQNVL